MAEIELAMDATLAGSGPKLVRAIGASGLAQKMREYQESAATYFEIALDKGQITSLEAPLVYYHLGELNRRAGELKKAERYYRLSHSHHAVSEKIKERAHSGLELVIQDEELYQELIDFVKADFIDDLPLDSIIEELEQEEAEPEDAEEIEPEEDEKEKPRYVGEAIDIGKKKTRQ